MNGSENMQTAFSPLRSIIHGAIPVAVVVALIVSAVLLRSPVDGFLNQQRAGNPQSEHHVEVVSPVEMLPEGLVVTGPSGTADLSTHGGHPFALPPTLRLRVGQTIEIRNQDRIAHVVLGMVVPAGEIGTRVVATSGYEIYSAGCAAHVTGTGLTTLIVSRTPASES